MCNKSKFPLLHYFRILPPSVEYNLMIRLEYIDYNFYYCENIKPEMSLVMKFTLKCGPYLFYGKKENKEIFDLQRRKTMYK